MPIQTVLNTFVIQQSIPIIPYEKNRDNNNSIINVLQ